tara:strand:- start:3193 stop:4671 length:1479 start_codon:yes stop_codon:yes gene_type:complete
MFRPPELDGQTDHYPLLREDSVAPGSDVDMAPDESVMSLLQSVRLDSWQSQQSHQDLDGFSPELRRIHDMLMSMDSPESSPSMPPVGLEEDGPPPFSLPASMAEERVATLSTAVVPAALPIPAESSTAMVVAESEASGPLPYKAKSRKVAHRRIEVDAGTCDVSAGGVTKKPHFISTKPPIDDKLHEKDFELMKQKKTEQESRALLLKNISREARSAAYHQRRVGTGNSSMYVRIWQNNRERGDTWAQLRYYQIVHLSRLLLKESGVRGAFLSNDMHDTLGNLAIMAINQVVRTPDNRLLPTASAPFWTLALAQEAWRRRPGNEGWSTNCSDAAWALSWEGMEALYHGNKYQESLKGAETHEQETTREPSARDVLRGRKHSVVRRKVVSHGLGHSHNEIIKKMQCLHELLAAAGDTLEDGTAGGLHPDIRTLMPPVVNRYPKPPPSLDCMSNTKARRIANHRAFGTNKPTAVEEKDLAEAAASVAAMGTDVD